MKNSLVYIIVLNWNGLQDTLDCLESVLNLNYPNFEVVVVDNGSTDNSPSVIKNKYPQVTLINNVRNFGFTGGNNIGMCHAMENGADYIWLLNNDTIVDRNSLSEIVELAEGSSKIGMVSPMIYFFDAPKKWQFAGSYVDWKELNIIHPESDKKVSKEFQEGKNVCLWGTALLIKRKVVETIGYLKEEFFAYWEDTEYSLRAITFNFQNVICNSAKIYHKHQGSDVVKIMVKNKYFYYYMQRNLMLLGNEFKKSKMGRFRFKIKCLGRASNFIGKCHQDCIEPTVLGVWHGLKHKTGEMPCQDKVPTIFLKILLLLSMCYPVFISDLITFNFQNVYRKIRIRIFNSDFRKTFRT